MRSIHKVLLIEKGLGVSAAITSGALAIVLGHGGARLWFAALLLWTGNVAAVSYVLSTIVTLVMLFIDGPPFLIAGIVSTAGFWVTLIAVITNNWVYGGAVANNLGLISILTIRSAILFSLGWRSKYWNYEEWIEGDL